MLEGQSQCNTAYVQTYVYSAFLKLDGFFPSFCLLLLWSLLKNQHFKDQLCVWLYFLKNILNYLVCKTSKGWNIHQIADFLRPSLRSDWKPFLPCYIGSIISKGSKIESSSWWVEFNVTLLKCMWEGRQCCSHMSKYNLPHFDRASLTFLLCFFSIILVFCLSSINLWILESTC